MGIVMETSELETEFSEMGCVVIDNGSHSVKAGFAGEDGPQLVFNSVVGRARHHGDSNIEDVYIGDEAQDKRDILSLNYPINYGSITNWDDMEKLWDYTFQQLGVHNMEYTLLLTDNLLSPKLQREKMTQIMFESYGTRGLHLCSQSLLPCYTVPHISGVLVIQCGDSLTTTHPIYMGYGITEAARSSPIGGKHLTDYLAKLLECHELSFSTVSEHEYVNEMKEECCRVSTDFESELYTCPKQTFTLPNDLSVSLGKECIQCPEALFKPSLLGLQCPSLPELVRDSIMACDVDLRQTLASNILLSGGTTLFENLNTRLEDELRTLLPEKLVVRVVSLPERKYSTWMGGSILASLCTFQRMWVSKAEYEEVGPSVVFRKSVT